jgi:hypothetical protein
VSAGQAPAPAPAAAVAVAVPAAGMRGDRPGDRASLAGYIDSYRVGEAEFRIDFGSLDRSQVPPPGATTRGVPVAVARTGAGAAGAAGVPTERGLPVAAGLDATVIGEAQRARYVRDTLAKFSAGLEKGRDASASEQDERPTP